MRGGPVSPEERLADEATESKAALCCPVCDVEGRSQLEALAIGVALGVAYRDIHRITTSMCANHRSQWFLAMVKAGRAVDSVLPEPIYNPAAVDCLRPACRDERRVPRRV